MGTLIAAYATAEEYRQILNVPDTEEDELIDMDLVAVARWIDHVCDRGINGFGLDTAAVTRLYYPWNGQSTRLEIDEIGSLTGLVVKLDRNRDGTPEVTLASTDYQLWGAGSLNPDKGAEPWPWDELRIPEWSTIRFFDALTSVTAQGGWPAVPRGVRAANIHVCGILRMQSVRAAGRIPEDIENIVDASPEAQKIVTSLLVPYMSGPAVR